MPNLPDTPNLPDMPGAMGECCLPPCHAGCCGPLLWAECWRQGGAGSTHAGTPPCVLRQHPHTGLSSSARVIPPSAHRPLVLPQSAGTCGASCTRPYAPFRDRSDSIIRKAVSAYHRMPGYLHFSRTCRGRPARWRAWRKRIAGESWVQGAARGAGVQRQGECGDRSGARVGQVRRSVRREGRSRSRLR